MSTNHNESNFSHLPYNPKILPRELTKYYISSTKAEQAQMLSTIGLKNLSDLYSHIPDNIKFNQAPKVCDELEYNDLIARVEMLANKNNLKTCFIGDGLKIIKRMTLYHMFVVYEDLQPPILHINQKEAREL